MKAIWLPLRSARWFKRQRASPPPGAVAGNIELQLEPAGLHDRETARGDSRDLRAVFHPWRGNVAPAGIDESLDEPRVGIANLDQRRRIGDVIVVAGVHPAPQAAVVGPSRAQMRGRWKRSIWLAAGIEPPPLQLEQPPGIVPNAVGSAVVHRREALALREFDAERRLAVVVDHAILVADAAGQIAVIHGGGAIAFAAHPTRQRNVFAGLAPFGRTSRPG